MLFHSKLCPFFSVDAQLWNFPHKPFEHDFLKFPYHQIRFSDTSSKWILVVQHIYIVNILKFRIFLVITFTFILFLKLTFTILIVWANSVQQISHIWSQYSNFRNHFFPRNFDPYEGFRKPVKNPLVHTSHWNFQSYIEVYFAGMCFHFSYEDIHILHTSHIWFIFGAIFGFPISCTHSKVKIYRENWKYNEHNYHQILIPHQFHFIFHAFFQKSVFIDLPIKIWSHELVRDVRYWTALFSKSSKNMH